MNEIEAAEIRNKFVKPTNLRYLENRRSFDRYNQEVDNSNYSEEGKREISAGL